MPLPRALAGAYAAAVTPLTPDGAAVDAAAIAPVVDLLHAAGIDGLLAMGTTGEGVLLDAGERRTALEGFSRAAAGRLTVIAHCGAQTTRDTVALAAGAGEAGADAVAVIPPPYFPLDDASLLAHLLAAARACAPLPFLVYEFADRSGYAVPLPVIAELRMRAPNLAGLKVSDSPFERVEPYLAFDGLAVLVGAEALIHRGLAGGAAGAVSGLAAALPEVVVEAVRARSAEASERAGSVRARVARFPFQAALKRILAARGVPLAEAVRAPLRGLTAAERAALDADLPALLSAAAAAR